jgi:Xaa-Pro aminopeptidase
MWLSQHRKARRRTTTSLNIDSEWRSAQTYLPTDIPQRASRMNTHHTPHLRTMLLIMATLGLLTIARSADFVERRQRAAGEFHDGILLLHASSELNASADGFHQDPFFYYFTGLENTVGAVLAIDGRTNESWLFLPSHPPFFRAGLRPEVQPGPEAEHRLAIQHVVDWSELKEFLVGRAGQQVSLYFANGFSNFDALPEVLLNAKSPQAPAWLQLILQKWPSFEGKEATQRVQDLMTVQNDGEIAALRAAAKATVTALKAGIRAVRRGSSQRMVESVVEDACWRAGAHGSSFWPWAVGHGWRERSISAPVYIARPL